MCTLLRLSNTITLNLETGLPIGLISLLACTGVPGKAKSGLNSETSCKYCASGKYSSNGREQLGSSSCPDCAPGKYSGSKASYCPLCAAGKYSKGPSGVRPLEKGQGECEPCASGKYSPSTGGSFCLDCPRGTWSTRSDSGTIFCTQCVGCAAGKTRGG